MTGELVVQLVDPVRPSVDELAKLMRARLEGDLARQPTFNAETTPTAQEAEGLIDIAEAMVKAKIGSAVQDSLLDASTKAMMFKAAALVEVTYYPEQANADNSAYGLYQAQYEELLAVLVEAANDNRPNSSRVGSVPSLGRHGYILPDSYFTGGV